MPARTGSRIIAVLTGLLLAACAHAQGTVAPRAQSSAGQPTPGETYLWRAVAIGGGGFITGLAMDPTGQVRVARSDVYGAYLWLPEANRWVQLVNADSMPAELRVQDGGNEGVFEVAIAPSRPDRIFLAFKGHVYRSDDRGRSFVRASPASPPARLAFDANSAFRHYGPVLAVSPANADLVLFGTPADGLWRSEDAGRRWQRVASVPVQRRSGAPEDAPGLPIWFAPTAGAPGDAAVWVMSPGVGMFVSRDAGRSFTPLAPAGATTPLSLRRGAFARDGSFFGADAQARKLWRYRGGQWTDLTRTADLPERVYAGVAIAPDTSEIYVADEGGKTWRSLDGGQRWKALSHGSAAGAGDPPWLRVSNQSYFATGMIAFDPVQPQRLWNAAGTGVYYADLRESDTHLRWTSQTRGIEELVANDVVQPTRRAPLFAAWDFGIHLKEDLDAFSRGYGPKERVLIAAQQMDWSAANPSFVVTNATDTRTFCCAEDGDAVLAGYSEDAGRTWKKFARLPQPPGTAASDPWRMSFGSIAVASDNVDNIVWLPSFNRSAFYTRDRGASWSRVQLQGEKLPLTGSHALYYYARKTLTADRSLPGTFYLVHSGEGGNTALVGLWRTSDGGTHWSRVHTGEIAPDSQHSAKLRSVPGQGGHLFFTAGVSGTPDTRLRRSTDGGYSWQALERVRDVDDVAFGKAALGAAYPTVFVSAKIDGVYGIWRSVDAARQWTRVAGLPVGTLDQVTVLGADPDVFGRVYVGYKGSGWKYGEPAACVPRPYGFPMDSECFGLQPAERNERRGMP